MNTMRELFSFVMLVLGVTIAADGRFDKATFFVAIAIYLSTRESKA